MGGSRDSEFERAMYVELTVAQRNLKTRHIETWGSGGSSTFLKGGQFTNGWVVTTSVTSGGWFEPLPFALLSEIPRSVANRFAGRGPVRLFWLDDSFRWLDARGSQDHFTSPLELDFETFGDAGLVVFPLIVPTSRGQAYARKEASWAKWGAWTLGSTPTVLSGAPGQTLIKAIEESDKGTVLNLTVPTKHYTGRGLPPVLEVMDRSGKVSYSRPFVTGGVETNGQGVSGDQFAAGLYRIVPELKWVGKAQVTTSCIEKQPAIAGRFLRLLGLEEECERCDAKLEFIVSHKSSMPPKLSTRGTVAFQQRGTSACVGPVDAISGARVLLYSEKDNWLASIDIP